MANVVETLRPAQEVADHLLSLGIMVRPLKDGLAHCLRVSVGAPAGNQRFVEGLTEMLEL